MNPSVKNLVVCAMCIALGIIFPIFFHMFGAIGVTLLPMHIPVLICGFLCGPVFGLVCGMITPILSSMLTGMPPFYPIAISMMLELATYGFLSGYLYKKYGVYPSLLIAMIAGRVVSGLVNLCLLSMAGKVYTLEIFLSASFVTAIPGIVLQIIVIPLLIVVFDKSGLWRKTSA